MYVLFRRTPNAGTTILLTTTDYRILGGGGVWCNPPYGREISAWVRKGYEESRKDYNDFVLMLLPARTDTKWWWDWVQGKAQLFFVKGRIRFNEGSAGAPFPSVLALYMKDIKGGKV